MVIMEALMANKDNKCCTALPSAIVVLAIIFAAIVNKESHSITSQRHCEPFKGYFVWDQSEKRSDFKIQRHYLARAMDNATRGTNITLKSGNQRVNFMKNTSRSGTQHVASVEFDSSQDNVMSYIVLKEDILKEKHKIGAFELFFFVNKNSKIDKEETAIKELKNNKVFVVYRGPESIPYFWKSLATDDNHLMYLKNYMEEDFLAFLNVICQDSGLYCDNDKYWNGTECVRCSFICTQMPSEYCKQECPYFELTLLGLEKSNGESSNTSIFIGFVITNMITLAAVILKMDYIRRKFECIFRNDNEDSHNSTDAEREKSSDKLIYAEEDVQK